MAEGVITVAPDSTGKNLRTRSRVQPGGSATVHEQYVITQKEQIVSSRQWVASFRTPARAVTQQPIFAIWNGGTNIVSIRRLSLEVDSIAFKNVLSPVVRLYRITAAPTGGTALVKVAQDTAETMSSGIVATGDASADGTVSGTAMAGTPNPTAPMWEQTIPRWQGTAMPTAAMWQTPVEMNLLPNDPSLMAEDPIYLRASQGILVRVDATAAMVLNDWHFYVKSAIGEFTIP